MSKQEFNPKGTKICEQSSVQQKTNYSIGCKEWDSQWKTMNNIYYEKKNPEKNFVIDKSKSQKTNYNIGSKELQGKGNNFQSETLDKFVQYHDINRVRPVLSKQELSKTNYSLGKDRNQYNTTNYDYDKLRQNSKVDDIQFKRDRVRYDIIQNRDINQNQLKQTANCFDFYNPEKNKGRLTNDYSYIPKRGDPRVDPITGRNLKY
ncbi:hypothetical protein PPERSA_06571 [Pseudocohnilembus persalinus]|uniref:Uncharacterized protein n=1 Tax=Pseudocohnilembus persalinus TaxID=266149 RepID=A0A0V0QRN1_PSEPJ|nr:hypothetical protein PPERSA_06571 [Pseudocohnilembus persalinus]|eukprot:KRX04937.1 hypothetical protein PPERSA_06571 [Pseudocohnilembus persalinus]